MPEGLDVTTPDPDTPTLRVKRGAKVAVTDFAPSIVMSQTAAEPVQAPDQPANTAPIDAAAVSLTTVPRG